MSKFSKMTELQAAEESVRTEVVLNVCKLRETNN